MLHPGEFSQVAPGELPVIPNMTTPSLLRPLRRIFSCLVSVGFVVSLFAATPEAAKISFDLPSAPAEQSLKKFSAQSGLEVIYVSATVANVTTPAVKGRLTPAEAIDLLLKDSSLIAVPDSKTGAYTVQKAATVAEAEKNGASRPANDRAAGEMKDGVLKLDTFEVMGSKLLNMDKPRSRDDVQPYVIYDHTTLERSGVSNLEEFFKQRLTMNTTSRTNSQGPNFTGGTSQINLRGLGTNQTLILIDGHRTSGPTVAGQPTQADVNGIPLAAIERVEVLPTTSSGIYGGNATGGVINIILRRDYVGTEIGLSYNNTFDGDASNRRLDFGTGFTLEDGKTSILIAGNYASATGLTIQDRDLAQRGRALVTKNNPSGINLAGIFPPLGYTSNIRNLSGANLVLKNGTPLNSPITFVPIGYAGAASDNGVAFVANAGNYNLKLPNTSQNPGGGQQALLNVPELESLLATFRRTFSSNAEAFIEVSGSNNSSRYPLSVIQAITAIPSAAINNPFTSTVAVTAPVLSPASAITSRTSNRRVIGGLIFNLPKQWNVELDYTWNQTRYNYASPPDFSSAGSAAISTGAFDLLRDTNVYPGDVQQYLLQSTFSVTPSVTTLRDATVRFAGPLFSLPAGEANVKLLLERREDEYEGGTISTGGSKTLFPSSADDVLSAYLESTVPLVSPKNRLNFVNKLDLQIAARADYYKINGVTPSVAVGSTTPIGTATNKKHSVNPTVGFLYEPVSSIAIRASYGTGFLPPSVTQLVATFSPGTTAFLDPKRGGAITQLGTGTVLIGGNARLRPEHSKSGSVGIIIKPEGVTGLRFSVDYTRITKTDNIATLTAQQIIDNEAIFQNRITRGPLPPGDAFSVGPVTALDLTSANISKALVEAFDVAVDYQKVIPGAGTWSLFFLGTWQTHYKTQILPTTPYLENVGNSRINPLKFRANGGLSVKFRQWSAGWTAQYYNSYLVADPATSSSATVFLNQGARRVPSQVIHDLFLRYEVHARSAGNHTVDDGKWRARFLENMSIQLNVNNVFNRAPAFDASDISAYYSSYVDPRMATYTLSIRKAF